jgi:hypothetical protein
VRAGRDDSGTNITVPASAANGDNLFSCTYGGSATPAGALITVQQ